MSKNYMNIIFKEPNKNAYSIKLSKTLNSMSKLIEGTMEYIKYEEVLILYNKNQNSNELLNNHLFEDVNFKGNILIVGNNINQGDFKSLTKKQILKYLTRINENCKTKEQQL